MSTLIQYDIYSSNIGVITLNRPDVANALSRQLLHDLSAKVTEINEDKSIRCLLITGEGIKAFSAGIDLKEREQMSEEEVIDTLKLIGNTITLIENMTIPTIAVVNGIALGGGLELALGCDMRIASEDIYVGLPETSLGIIPGAGGTQRLTRLIGIGQAKRMIFSAKKIMSHEAYAIGLVEEIVERHNLLSTALHRAEIIANNAPIAVKQAKQAIDKGLHLSLEESLVVEHECYKQTLSTEDRLEGLRAFKEKRDPSYQGK